MDDQKRVTVPRKRRGLRVLGVICGVLVLLLSVAWFVGTSEGFLKSVILPRVSKAMNATVTVDHASISPFSHVRFQNLKVVTIGTEPLLTAQDVNARYNLMKIIGGNIVVQEVEIASPVIQIIQNADGSSNLDPLTQGKKEPRKDESKPSKPPKVDIQKFVLSNATVRQIKNHKEGGRDLTEISKLNVTLNNLQNGQSGKLQLNADLAMNNNPPAPGTNGTLQGKLNGNFDFDLKPDLMPASVKGNTEIAVQNASGAFGDLVGLGANLIADLTPAEIRQVALRFQKSGASLGELRVSGPFDSSRLEGKLQVGISSVDRQLLNFVGAAQGLDFGSTTISSTNQIELAKGGMSIMAAGQLQVAKLAVKKDQQVTPTLDLQTAYHVIVDRSARSAEIRTLSLHGVQNERQLLRGDLTSPMKVSWGDNANTAGDSAFNLAVTGLNFADWKPFIGELAPAGVVGLNLKVASQQSGKLLTFDTSSQLQNVSAKMGSNAVSGVNGSLSAQGSAMDLKRFELANFKVDLTQQNQPMVSLSGGGQYDKMKDSADLRIVMDANIPTVLKLLNQTNATASAGKAGFNGRLVKSADAQTFSGNLTLADFTGRYDKYQFDRFGTVMDVDVSMKGKQMLLRKAEGKINSGPNQGGSFSIAGNFDSEKRNGQFDVKMIELNQNALRPFLESMLHDKKLQSVTINSTSSARLTGESSDIKADFQLSNLVVIDPKNSSRQPALETKLHLDAGMAGKVVNLRQLQVNLTPTQKAKNELQLTGKVDLTDSNAITGNLKLASDSIDVTRYYDLLSGKSADEQAKSGPAATGPASPGETSPSSRPQKEPEPVKLPVKNFIVDATVGRFYLRELEVTNLHTGIKLDQSRVVIDPFQLAVNGGPVTSKVDLDLSVPGYRYNVNLDARQIPLEPLANSFVPEKRGMYKGNLIAGLKVNGAGITGVSMKKSLGGELAFNFTNANIQIVNPQLRGFLMPIAAFLGAPDLLDSPVNQIDTEGTIGGGRISISRVRLVSDAFLAESKGDVLIADDLMQSTFNNWPMHFSVRSSLAQKIRIAPQNAPAGQPYVALPDFIQVAGTLQSPKPKLDLNTKAIAGTVLDKLGGKLPDDKGGNLVQGLKGILGGKTATNAVNTNNINQPTSTNTNANRTNAPAGLNPLDLLDQFKRKK